MTRDMRHTGEIILYQPDITKCQTLCDQIRQLQQEYGTNFSEKNYRKSQAPFGQFSRHVWWIAEKYIETRIKTKPDSLTNVRGYRESAVQR